MWAVVSVKCLNWSYLLASHCCCILILGSIICKVRSTPAGKSMHSVNSAEQCRQSSGCMLEGDK